MAKRVIVALMDGVRPDAIGKVNHPFFEKLKKQGLSALTGRTVVPPRAFPAHISLFTSVGPEKHGIVSNDICPFPESYASLMQIRREAGKHAILLNDIVEILASEDLPEVKLKEFVGHTPFQVMAGILIGIVIGALGYQFVI